MQGMAESMMRNPAFAQMAQGTAKLCLVVEKIPAWSTNKCALHACFDTRYDEQPGRDGRGDGGDAARNGHVCRTKYGAGSCGGRGGVGVGGYGGGRGGVNAFVTEVEKNGASPAGSAQVGVSESGSSQPGGEAGKERDQGASGGLGGGGGGGGDALERLLEKPALADIKVVCPRYFAPLLAHPQCMACMHARHACMRVYTHAHVRDNPYEHAYIHTRGRTAAYGM